MFFETSRTSLKTSLIRLVNYPLIFKTLFLHELNNFLFLKTIFVTESEKLNTHWASQRLENGKIFLESETCLNKTYLLWFNE